MPTAPARLAVLLLCLPSALAAQSSASTIAFDNWFDSLWALGTAKELATLKPAETKGSLALTRLAIWEWRAAQLGTNRVPFDNALMTIDRALRADERSAYTWYLLGQVSQEMWFRKFLSKQTERQPPGQTYYETALAAYQEAVRRDSTFTDAANAFLRLLATNGKRPKPGEAIETPRSPVSPEAALAQARLSFDGGKYDEALAAMDDYLDRGGSAGVAGLERGRALAGLERWPEALNSYLSGLRQLDSAGRAAYREDVALVAQQEELSEFDTLPLPRVGPWIARFWLDRDAMELRAPNERLREHLRRVVYAYRNYLLLRPGEKPAFAEGIDPRDYVDPMETELIKGVDVRRLVILQLSEPIPRFPTYHRTQWDIDDRGVLYVRHGEPAERVSSVRGVPNESWKYYFPDGPRIFHFLGSKALGTVAATTLVASLPMNPDILSARNTMDPSYEHLASRVEALIENPQVSKVDPRDVPTLGGAVLQREISRNQQAIKIGVTTDGFPLVFKRSLDALVQVYGVGLGQGEVRRILGVFAVPGWLITPQPRTDGGVGLAYSVSIRLVAMDRARAVIRQLDTVRVFTFPDTLRREQYLTGFVELAVPAGTFQVRALVSSGGADAGFAAGRDNIRIPDSPTELTLSDLILGRQGTMSWNYGGRSVALNPLNAYPKGGDGELFYEVAGLVAGRSYGTTVSIRRSDAKADSKPDIELATAFDAREPYQQIAQGIGLADLKPGSYTLTVTVREQGSERVSRRSQALNVLDK